MKCLSEIAPTNQVRQSLQELAHMNRGTVKVEEAFGKDRNRNDATAQNWPHQQSALLDVINHVGFSSALS
jgi:hypothetical protein